MEHYFALGDPQEANDSISTPLDAEEAPAYGSNSCQAGSGAFIPMAPRSLPVEGSMPQDFVPNVTPDVAADPRFRLGIETGRWFAGSFGDVYELLDSIGSGSASTVYKCKTVRAKGLPRDSDSPAQAESSRGPLEQDDMLAVKAIDLKGLKLNRNFNREVEKLRKEAQYLRTLRHPCIVRFIDYVETSDAIFIVQEYLKGGELFYKIVEKGCLSEQQACFIAHQVLAAIVFMHNSKIIHRDIKPENILIHDEVEDGFYRVKVADFGLAKTLASYGALATTMVGTPQYWAPEVINCGAGNTSGSYGYEADLWSFGVCLYVFLGGTYPFDGANGPIQQLVLNGRFHFRHSRFNRVSDDAKDLIRRALVVDQSRRITEKEIFYHPWMTRWLCDFDRSRLHLPSGASTAFRFMPPLPPLASRNAPYPPSAWQTDNKQERGRRGGNHGSSDIAVEPSISGAEDGRTASGEANTGEKLTAGAVELCGDSADAPGVSVGAMLPGFVKTSEPIPPFHLPILLPLQLHLLLSVHLLLLSLRESQSNLLLTQKLQRELWSLQRCVHTAVGFFEVTATSAIETLIDIAAVFDGGDDRGDSCGALEAVRELFAQVRRWTCEMQKQGERLGMRYERAEASVSDLICCVVTAVTSTASNARQQASEQQQRPQELRPKNDGELGVDTEPIGDKEKAALPEEQSQERALRPTCVQPSPEGHKRALVSPLPASHEKGAPKDPCFSENGIGLWGVGGSATRMDMLREFLASNLRRMLYSFAQPPIESPLKGRAPSAADDKQQVDAGVQAWSQVGKPDPSIVTDEILDFLFLSTRTAASHARQMTQPSENPGECYTIGGRHTPSGGSVSGDMAYFDQDALNMQKEGCHFESAPGGSKGPECTHESPPPAASSVDRGAQQEEKEINNNGPHCAELSFLCEAGSPTSSSNTALQDKIAVSRLQLRSLEKLRQMSYILTCVCSFWSNFDVILCRLLQLQQTTETLTKHTRASWVNKRAHQRLRQLKDCWIKFRTQCRIYLQLSNARNAKLMDLGLHVQMRADQLDAIRALRGMPEE